MKEKEILTDAQNPDNVFNLTHTDLLCAIVNGEIDPVQLAREQLASRGLDHSGKWIGFDAAEKLSRTPTHSEIKVGSHVWAFHDGEMNVFLKGDENEFYIAGAWEGSFKNSDIEIVSLIVEPKTKGGAK